VQKMSKSILDLSGQVAIVTGGGTGLGQAIAVEFARAGADLTVSSRNPAHLETTAHQVQALGRKCLALPTDVREPEQVKNMVQKTLDEYGRIDVMVNNAGANFFVPAEKMSPNAWNTIVAINLTGTFLCCQAVFDTMVKQKSGVIINMSSVAGRDGDPAAAHYGAAKAGIINLTKTLAMVWGKYGIRVNCIAPGPIATEGARWAQDPKHPGFHQGLCRGGRPEEVAYPTLFLASKGASYINGVTLWVDGAVELGRSQG